MPVETQPDLETAARHAKKRRCRAKSEAYTKSPWFEKEIQNVDVVRNARYSAPPMVTVASQTAYVSDEDPFRKEPLSTSTMAPTSFFMDMEKEKRRVSPQKIKNCIAYLMEM